MEDYFYFSIALETIGDLEPGLPSPIPRRTTSRSRDFNASELRHHHYLDACFRCRRMLGGNNYIFMYRRHPILQRGFDADDASETKKRSKQPVAAARGEQQRQSLQGVPVWAR